VIAHNPERHPKTLWSGHGPGEQVRYRLLDNGDLEADWVVKDLNSARHRAWLDQEGKSHELTWNDFSILYRTNAQARAFEEGLRGLNIPYQIIGGTRFFDRKEIRDALAYLRLIINPDDENALRRVINYPQRGIGDTTLERLSSASQARGLSMWSLCLDPTRIGGLSPAHERALFGFAKLLEPYQGRIERERWSVVFLELMQTINFKEALTRQYKDGPQALRRWSHIQEIAQGLDRAQDYWRVTSLNDYLNRLTLDHKPKENEARDEVTLMSLHSSKGLEFHSVYIVGFEEGWMPHERQPGEGVDLEEERRLAYVGITRAQRRLTLTSAAKRLSRGKSLSRRVSRFLEEIPEECLEGGRSGQPNSAEVKRVTTKRKLAFADMLSSLGKS
jgi:superfamily I DNA/RNA helicase